MPAVRRHPKQRPILVYGFAKAFKAECEPGCASVEFMLRPPTASAAASSFLRHRPVVERATQSARQTRMTPPRPRPRAFVAAKRARPLSPRCVGRVSQCSRMPSTSQESFCSMLCIQTKAHSLTPDESVREKINYAPNLDGAQ